MIELNVISDERNARRPGLEAHLTERGVPYRIWEAEVYPDCVVRSINASHKKIVRWAREEGLERVAIAEDDVYFPAQDGWQYWLIGEPRKYDLYLGGCYSDHTDSNCDRKWHFVVVPVGLHCYMIDSRFYDYFLSIPDDMHIDTACECAGALFKVCYPFAAIQRPGISANNRAHADYNALLKPGDVYGGLPDWTKL